MLGKKFQQASFCFLFFFFFFFQENKILQLMQIVLGDNLHEL